MKKLISEEIERIMLLSKYDSKKTLTENKQIILEFNPKSWDNLISTFKKGSDSYYTLKRLENAITSNITLKGKNKKIFTFKNTDDLVSRLDELDSVGKVNLVGELFKKADTAGTPGFKEKMAELISSSDGFRDKYSKITNYDEAIDELKKVGNYTDEEAKLLLDKSGIKYNKNTSLIKRTEKDLPVTKDFITSTGGSTVKNESKLKVLLKKYKDLAFKNKWKIFAGLGVGAIIWWLSNDDKTPFPLCIVNKLKQSDIDKFKGNAPDFILISNTGNKELDTYGGGKFFDDGDFESGNGSLTGTWESTDSEVIIQVSNKTYSIPCLLHDPNDSGGGGESTTTEPEKDKVRECDTFPFDKGCVNSKIKEIQKCLGAKETSILDDETDKKLRDSGYQTTITQTVYDRIMRDCVKETKPKYQMSSGGQTTYV